MTNSIRALIQDDLGFGETTGISYNIYFTGCSIRCPGCHNMELWDINAGHEILIEDIITNIKHQAELIDAVCILGGEPTDQYEGLVALLTELNKLPISIWLYTGLDFNNEKVQRVAKLCDYIKCGEYDVTKQSKTVGDIINIELVSGNQYFKRGGRIYAS